MPKKTSISEPELLIEFEYDPGARIETNEERILNLYGFILKKATEEYLKGRLTIDNNSTIRPSFNRKTRKTRNRLIPA